MVWKDTWPWDFSLCLVSQGVLTIPDPKPAAEGPEMQLLRYSKYILDFLHPSVKSCIQVPGPTGPAIREVPVLTDSERAFSKRGACVLEASA